MKKKTKHKHRSYNEQKRQGQTQAIQWTKKTKDKQKPYNEKKDKAQTQVIQ
jgi:hypothetical protein